MRHFQERCWQNLDKLILCFLFLVTMGSAIWVQMAGISSMDESSLDWARHNTDLVLAGLLGLMGGRAWASHTAPTLDKPPEEPPAKPPG